mmetsp:Transcript_27171/g.63203  ORF Transcript_27171/g.63203 Transcript_27171/m.63203 type:complete len:383 (+) Transcript_27171:83-1231(+)
MTFINVAAGEAGSKCEQETMPVVDSFAQGLAQLNAKQSLWERRRGENKAKSLASLSPITTRASAMSPGRRSDSDALHVKDRCISSMSVFSTSTSPDGSEQASPVSTASPFPRVELPDLLHSLYVAEEVVACGSTCRVVRATCRSSGRYVALKVMKCRDEEMMAVAEAEYKLMRRIEHPNIVRALDFHVCGGRAVTVMDYFHGVSLDKAVHQTKEGFVPEETTRSLTQQLLSAIACLHRNGILHRDIKPENVLVSHDMTHLCLVDFNTATAALEPLTPAGTLLYNAPEVLDGQPSTQAADVWGAGVCVYLMLSGRLPQERGRDDLNRRGLCRLAHREVSCSGKQWESVSSLATSFVGRCLAVEASCRPSTEDILVDSWLGSVP